MKMINDLRNILLDNDFKIILNNKYINVRNYDEIIDVGDKKILLKYNNSILEINGTNLTIKKMIYDEILIEGNILKVLFL